MDPVQVSELIFEVTQEADGGYVAEWLSEPIVTQGDSWNELRANVKDAIRLHFVRNEILTLG
jgi:predicted RNase H-like HicB family nuclease